METTRRKKIIRLCRTTCTACILLFPVFAISRLLMVFFGQISSGISADLSVMRQILFYTISIVRYGTLFYGLLLLRRQFDLYGKGVFYTAENVVCFRGIGWVLVSAAVMNTDLTVVLMDGAGLMNTISYSVSYANTVRYTALSLVYLSFNLMPGLLLLLISWTMDEGRLIKEEQEQFI